MKFNLSATYEKVLTWLTTNGVKLVIGLVLLYIGWKLINKLVKILVKILKQRNIDATLTSFAEAFCDISLKILLVITLMSYVGFDVAGLAALIASAGLAVGLALQGSLSNFAGGVIILLLRPFRVGDFIEAAGYTGTVEKITVFYTHLATPDNKEILIPNGTLANGSLINYSAKETRRVDLVFGVGYDDDIIKVKNVLWDVINKNELILKNPEPFVGISEHGASSVNFAVRVWCKKEDYWTIYFDLLEQVKLRFDDEKISIPYPQMDVHLTK
ncbi:mechanosensitive ion channel family protein [Clostridium sp. B9]|uniref:mechanosensitive ion channel family protein n=1 Tax=Clostridium sp. B9 TaxID=3423224 RepID=UPI003D2F1129